MYAKKVYVETDTNGRIKSLPQLPQNSKFEVIILSVDDKQSDEHVRKVSPIIFKKLKINGDIFSSAPVDCWNLPE